MKTIMFFTFILDSDVHVFEFDANYDYLNNVVIYSGVNEKYEDELSELLFNEEGQFKDSLKIVEFQDPVQLNGEYVLISCGMIV